MQQKFSIRERIVAAAKTLFAENGFHKTAMADLADYAQVSVGAIYRSFSSKAEIIKAIVEADTCDTLRQLQTDTDQVCDGTISGAVALERMLLDWLSKYRDALSYEIVAESHRNPEIAETIESVCGQFRDQLRTIAKLLRPDLDDMEIEGLAELLLACLFGMGNRRFTRPRLDEAETAAVVTRLFLDRLGGPKA